MSNAATDSNTNIIGVFPQTNVMVSSVTLTFSGWPSRKAPRGRPHRVFLIGQFNAYTSGANGNVTAGILVDGKLIMDTEVSNLQDQTDTILSLSGVVTVEAGTHVFDLQAFVLNATEASVHHRSLTAIDLEK